jgi:CubicO group peptidase (beta-lactamase class C family)
MNNKNFFIVVLIATGVGYWIAFDYSEPAKPVAPPEIVADGPTQISMGLKPRIRIEGRDVKPFTLAERMVHHKVPGVSIAFMQNHKVVWTLTQGVIDTVTNRPVDENTVFQAASISKPTFATTLMHYRQSNPLDLDVDVNTLLKSWQLPAHEWSDTKPVTLRRLLSHSAGTTVHGFGGYAAGVDVPTTIQVLEGNGPANSAEVIVGVEPHTVYDYSGGGTTLAQLVLEEQSGRTLPDLAKEFIFDPLAMTRSAYSQPLNAELSENAAVPYDRKGEAVEGGAHTYATIAAAGLWTTPSDLLKLGGEVQLAYHGKSDKILTQESAVEMLTYQFKPVGVGFFLTGEDDKIESFGHGGANAGFRANFFNHTNTGDGIAIMTNSDNGGALMGEIMIRVAEVYGWSEDKPVIKKINPMTADQLKSFVGNYKADNDGEELTIIITQTEEGLLFNVDPYVIDQAFLPEASDKFFALDGGRLSFDLDDLGNVTALNFAGMKATKIKGE